MTSPTTADEVTGRPAPAPAEPTQAAGGEAVRPDGEELRVADVGKLVRLATMARMLLFEAHTIDLDDAATHRFVDVYNRSVTAMAELLPDGVRDEFADLQTRFDADSPPTVAEVRIAQAQLVGWLEGLFQGIRVALLTQQLASQEQLAQVYADALREARRQEERELRSPYL